MTEMVKDRYTIIKRIKETYGQEKKKFQLRYHSLSGIEGRRAKVFTVGDSRDL